MNIRTVLGVGALLLAAAMPATSLGQRSYGNYTNVRSGYSNRTYGYGTGQIAPQRIGGATVYFGSGGGYGYSSPVFAYSYPYPVYGGYLSPLGYGYPSYYGGTLGYTYGYGY